jgi:membrane protein DedA with SNARE-associated domain/membrane-associated phospholipid phosphatase
MLNHFVDGILNLPLNVLSQWGYAIVFVFSAIEALPLIGLVIPGGVIVIAAGFFVKIGVLHMLPTIVVVSVGAFVGDAVAYFLGCRYGYNFLVQIGKYIFFRPTHFESAKKILQAHPRKAIIGGRFHALTRCIMPFAAGSAEVKPSLFLPFTILSAVLWAMVNVLIGFVFGQGFQVASHYFSVIFFVAFVLSILVVYSYQFVSRFTQKNRYVIQHFQIYPLLLNIISIYVVAKVTESVFMGARIHRLDIVINHFFQKFQSPFLTDFFMAVTLLATPTNLTIIGCVLAVYFMYRHRWYFLALFPASLFSGIVFDSILKKMVHVARPLFPLVPTSDFSFPSGHATVAIIFFSLIAYFFKDSIKSILWRRIYIVVCALVALIICVSRLYLNAHWFSDVLAGVALGVFCVTLFIVLFHFFTSLSPHRIEQEFAREIKEEEDILS